MIIEITKEECQCKTVGDAHWYAELIGIDYAYYKERNQEEIFFLKIARELRNIGCNRAAGRCYVRALDHSMRNYCMSQLYGRFVCVSNFERIYRITINFYVELGSLNYLKVINKRYIKALYMMQLEKELDQYARGLDRKNDIQQRVDTILDKLIV